METEQPMTAEEKARLELTRKGRRSYEETSVVMWMNPREKYSEAKYRLDLAWKEGFHPAQALYVARIEKRNMRRGHKRGYDD